MIRKGNYKGGVKGGRYPKIRPADETWKDDSLCKGVNPDVFFLETPLVDTRSVKAIRDKYCDKCPVQLQCFEFAVAIRANRGVWGGHRFTARNRTATIARARQRIESLH